MIVTCESCKSRYKLDDARITGRGAKITCPRCKTVFVVYAREAVAPTTVDTSVDEEDEDGGDEPTRRGATVSVPAPTHEATVPTKAAVPVEMAARAAALDFKAVGVNAWKVKVKIGLIYDFSDLKTLRKYITDARVTTNDVISHDGKNWKVIGEIPDLDAFFVETWEALSAAYKDAPPPPPKKTPAAEPEAKKSGEPEPNRFADPFEEQRRKAEAKRKGGGTGAVAVRSKDGKDAKDAGKTGASQGGRLAAAAAVLALAGGAWWFTRAPEAPAPTTAETPTKTEPAAAATAGATTTAADATAAPAVDPTIQKLNADLAAVQARSADLPKESETQVLIPVRRDGAAPNTAASVKAPGAAPSSAMKTSTSTAAEFEQAGDLEAKSGNWSTAIAAYRKAAAMDSKNANIHFKLGYSLYRAKDDASVVELDAAARLGRTDAYKVLGDIAAEQGDVSGAMSRYQQYLKTKPRDAADIERKMRELSGG